MAEDMIPRERTFEPLRPASLLSTALTAIFVYTGVALAGLALLALM